MTGYEVTIKKEEHTRKITKCAKENNVLCMEPGRYLFRNAEDALWFYFNIREGLSFLKIDPVNIEVEEDDSVAA